MHHAEPASKSHSGHAPAINTSLVACAEACRACAQACRTCADACATEPNADEMARCIRLDQDCADICDATAKVLSRASEADPTTLAALLGACAAACDACGTECEGHASMEHCRVCAEACRACESACRKLIDAHTAVH